MKKIYKFPENFLIGSATAAEQIEPRDGKDLRGGKSLTCWSWMYKVIPWFFRDKMYCQNNFYDNWEKDLELASELGLNSLRMSISWSRFMPDGVNVNREAIVFYQNIFNKAKKLKIKLIISLFHFDLPNWLRKKGGFKSPQFHEYFEHYSKEVFKAFPNAADFWVTFNESQGMFEGILFAPKIIGPLGKGNNGFVNGIRSIWNINVAHAKAVKAFRESEAKGKIGGVYVGSNMIASTEEDKDAAKIADDLYFKAFFDPNVIGEFPQDLRELLINKKLWPFDIEKEEHYKLFKKYKSDFAGVNYYNPFRIKKSNGKPKKVWSLHPDTKFLNHKLKGLFEMVVVDENTPNIRYNSDRGWEINPSALYDRLMIIKNDYNNFPTIVTENGMGVANEDRFKDENGVIQDTYRIDFLSEHMYYVHKAIQDGANVFGFHQWTYIDNWSWMNAYKNRYGYYELDLKTGERKQKLSASWIKNVTKTNSIEFEEEK